jgi:hypothetical protein
MEDEGRTEMCGTYKTRKEAEKAIDRLSENDKGYFRRSNFEIISNERN